MGDAEEHGFPPYVIGFITEVLGTATMMYVGCMGCIELYGIGPVIPAFSFGLAILAAVQMFHHFGPVHLNPAVSVAFLIMGKMPWKYFLLYLLGQFIGAQLGYAFLTLLTPYKKEMCLLKVEFGLSTWQCFINEAGCSMVLIMLILGAVDEKNKDLKDSLPLRIPLGVSGIIFSLAPFTGAGLNPARAMPPPFFHSNYEDLWVYTAGPLVGMILGSVFYRFVLDDGEPYSLHAKLKPE